MSAVYDADGESMIAAMRQQEQRELDREGELLLEQQVHDGMRARANRRQVLFCGCQSRLSLCSWAFVLSHGVGLVLLTWLTPQLAAGCYIVMVPTGVLVLFTRYQMKHANANETAWAYTLGYLPAVLVAVVAETVLRLLIVYALLGVWSVPDVLMRVLGDSASPLTESVPPWWQPLGLPYHVLWFVSRVMVCYVAAALVEETVKYGLCQWIRRSLRLLDPCLLIFYSMAAAVGFGTAESLSHVGDAAERSGVWGGVVVATVRLLTPLHECTMMMVAVDTCRRETFESTRPSTVSLLTWPVLIHGSFDLCLSLVPADPAQQLGTTVVLCLAALVCFLTALGLGYSKFMAIRQTIVMLNIEPQS